MLETQSNRPLNRSAALRGLKDALRDKVQPTSMVEGLIEQSPVNVTMFEHIRRHVEFEGWPIKGNKKLEWREKDKITDIINQIDFPP